MSLTYNDALRSIHNKRFPPTNSEQLIEINSFLLYFASFASFASFAWAQSNIERSSVDRAVANAITPVMARLADMVRNILQTAFSIVTFNGDKIVERTLQVTVFPTPKADVVL
jgi:hypothetical protein